MLRAALALALVACSSPSTPRTSTYASEDGARRFEDVVQVTTSHLHAADPAEAVSLGHHEHDGALPDRSPRALADLVAQLAKDRQQLVAFTALTPAQALERDVLVRELNDWLFRLVDLDVFRANPMAYSDAINLDAYILRDYGPAPGRAAAIVTLCRGVPAYLAQARANVKTPIPRPWIDTALLQTRGLAEFADKDVRAEVAKLDLPAATRAALGPALDTCKAALVEHAAWLAQQQPQGTTAFALGEAKFLKMLADTQGVHIELDRLAAIADADLRRNLAAIEAAARAIDPKRPTAEVVHAQAALKPAPTAILGVATTQATEMRRFLVEHAIVSIPSDDVAEVRESPAFRRWNAASLDRPGPFEKQALPSFYYISPPDPTWPVAEQQAYIIPTNDLLFTTIHELWPGHFLQALHLRRHPSSTLQSYCTYSNSEGWAHYTEEMMFDAGAGDRTPQARIGMLKEALLRNARFVAAIGEHARGMTVEQATKLFETSAFVDPGNARQQAVRGTFDPMYLAYTIGKLMIVKLRDDWMTQHPGATLRDFHDAFLAYGCAPIPLIRDAMLGPSAGPAL